jgi:8-oxo-dGTP pyrophosphatase MutT (NUDIX family)
VSGHKLEVAKRMSASLANQALRIALTALHRLLKLGWRVRRPRTFGAHALAFTPEGRIVLVKLRYAPGWRLPGGGRAPDENPADAVLRELREEIGMISHGRVRLACELEEQADFKQDLASLLIVEDVRYSPRWSLEIEQVMESALDDLPPDLSPITARWIEAINTRSETIIGPI